jgi:hypothetical protein
MFSTVDLVLSNRLDWIILAIVDWLIKNLAYSLLTHLSTDLRQDTIHRLLILSLFLENKDTNVNHFYCSDLAACSCWVLAYLYKPSRQQNVLAILEYNVEGLLTLG